MLKVRSGAFFESGSRRRSFIYVNSLAIYLFSNNDYYYKKNNVNFLIGKNGSNDLYPSLPFKVTGKLYRDDVTVTASKSALILKWHFSGFHKQWVANLSHHGYPKELAALCRQGHRKATFRTTQPQT